LENNENQSSTTANREKGNLRMKFFFENSKKKEKENINNDGKNSTDVVNEIRAGSTNDLDFNLTKNIFLHLFFIIIIFLLA